MQIGRITGATRVLGKSQGYMGLPLRDVTINCAVNGPDTPAMVTAWLPDPAELAALNAGAPVHVRILGRSHPPIMVDVGEAPIEEPRAAAGEQLPADTDPAGADFIARRCERLIGEG